VHHRKALAEDMNAGEAALFQDLSAAIRFQKCQAQQQINPRRQANGVLGKFRGDLIRCPKDISHSWSAVLPSGISSLRLLAFTQSMKVEAGTVLRMYSSSRLSRLPCRRA
jgi:hypothetical protein